MRDRDLLAALVYDELRTGKQRSAPTPQPPPVAAAAALLGMIGMIIALAAFLWLVFTLSAILG